MATKQFTAGPWRVGDAGHTVFGPPNGNPSPETICHTQMISNARLIAAAPDLLAALEALVKAEEDYGNPSNVAINQALETAFHALAKATS